MATLSTAARNAAANAVVDLIDGGTGAGSLKIYDSGQITLLAELPLSATAFGAASGGVATAASITSDTSPAANGTAAEYTVCDGDGTVIWSGNVSTSGADLNLNTVSITTTGTVSITSLTYTQPAS